MTTLQQLCDRLNDRIQEPDFHATVNDWLVTSELDPSAVDFGEALEWLKGYRLTTFALQTIIDAIRLSHSVDGYIYWLVTGRHGEFCPHPRAVPEEWKRLAPFVAVRGQIGDLASLAIDETREISDEPDEELMAETQAANVHPKPETHTPSRSATAMISANLERLDACMRLSAKIEEATGVQLASPIPAYIVPMVLYVTPPLQLLFAEFCRQEAQP